MKNLIYKGTFETSKKGGDLRQNLQLVKMEPFRTVLILSIYRDISSKGIIVFYVFCLFVFLR